MFNLTVKTDQEAFDAIAAHLNKGKGRCMGPKGVCAYYDEDTDNNCAIGAIVDDPASMENAHMGEGVDTLFRERVLDVGNVSLRLLTTLQTVHDGPENWRGKKFTAVDYLKSIGLNYGLSLDNLPSGW